MLDILFPFLLLIVVTITSAIGESQPQTGYFKLQCEVSSRRQLHAVLWTRNGETITSSVAQQYTLDETVTQTNTGGTVIISSTLVLLDFMNDVGKDFRCVAWINEHTEGNSRQIDVECRK